MAELMSTVARFKANQVRRQVEQRGQHYVFERYVLNTYQERTESLEEQVSLRGIYSTRKVYISRPGSDGTVNYTLDKPIITVAYTDFELNPVQFKDTVTINGQLYEVLAITNVHEMNFAIQISLQEVK